MSKRDLAAAIRKATDCSSGQANDAVDAVLDTIRKKLKKEGRFSLVGFGGFHVGKQKRRKGRNPQTGESIWISARKTVRFKASSILKKKV